MYLRTRAWFFCGSAILLPELRFWPVRRHNQYKRVTWLVDIQGQAEAQAGLMQQQRVRRAGGRGDGGRGDGRTVAEGSAPSLRWNVA